MTTDDRREALRNLIDLKEPVADAARRVREFPWDSDTELVILTRLDLAGILDLYLQGKLDGSELEQWAEALEGRDDVGYEGQAVALLKQIIFELANPEITSQLDSKRAREWKEGLAPDD
jgi:hypothetical protein